MLPSTSSSRPPVDGPVPRSAPRVAIPVHSHTPTQTLAPAQASAPPSASAPVSGVDTLVSNATGSATESGFAHRQPVGALLPTATTSTTGFKTGIGTGTGTGNGTGNGNGNGAEPQPGSRPLQPNLKPPSSNASSPSVYKRGPSSSLDGDVPSPESSTSQPAPYDTSSAFPPDQRNKKRRTGPGSRGVANLTPEQLAKKRANDREAQRAIRERTKNQIESLEHRIRELTSQQPYQELQKIIRHKEAVEVENAELRARMGSIMTLIQPFLPSSLTGGVGVSPDPGYSPLQPAQQQPPEPQQHQQPSAYSTHNTSTPGSIASPSQATDSSWAGQSSSQSNSYQQTNYQMDQQNKVSSQRHDRVQNLHLGGGEQLRLDFLLDPSQRIHKMQVGVNGAQDSPEYNHLPMKHDWKAATHASQRNNRSPAGFPALPQQQIHRQQQQQQQQHRIEYAHRPSNPALPFFIGVGSFVKHCEPTCTLDGVLLDFLNERRQRAAEGVSPQEIVGPKYPSISSLLNQAHSAYAHPLSKVFTDILTTFPAISRLPEKIAVLYVMFMIMRWQINSTEENYELTPPFARPLPVQFNVPHPAWVDHVPFPAMREKIVQEYNPAQYLLDDFFVPYTTTLSLNWPYDDTDTLLECPDGEIIINPVFRRHLCREENWTLGPAFDKAFPTLRGTYNLKSDVGVSEQDGTLNQ